jgi:hypothetical protein
VTSIPARRGVGGRPWPARLVYSCLRPRAAGGTGYPARTRRTGESSTDAGSSTGWNEFRPGLPATRHVVAHSPTTADANAQADEDAWFGAPRSATPVSSLNPIIGPIARQNPVVSQPGPVRIR